MMACQQRSVPPLEHQDPSLLKQWAASLGHE